MQKDMHFLVTLFRASQGKNTLAQGWTRGHTEKFPTASEDKQSPRSCQLSCPLSIPDSLRSSPDMPGVAFPGDDNASASQMWPLWRSLTKQNRLEKLPSPEKLPGTAPRSPSILYWYLSGLSGREEGNRGGAQRRKGNKRKSTHGGR